MSIIMDEVNGQFRGIELGNDNPTKTILSVMISSLTSNFSEIVSMVPLNKLDSSIMKNLFTLVVHKLVEIDIDPVCCLVNGHPTNRKFYRELCGGNLEVSIINPANISSFIHTFFDPTHILKCVYNNFFTRRLLKFPDFAGERIEANFDHIVSL